MRDVGRRSAIVRSAERGAAAVEFALVLPILLALVFGIIQYGIYFYSAQTGTAVANAALRKLAVGDCQNIAELKPFVVSRLKGAASGTVTVERHYFAEAVPPATPVESVTPVTGGTVSLKISYQTLNMHFPFLPFLSDSSITKSIDARQEDDQAEGACS